MKIRYAIGKFKINNKIKFQDIEKLRGNIINKFSNIPITHNHYENGKSIYRFPEIQYKIINNKLSMMFFNDNIDLILNVYNNINYLKVGDKLYNDIEKDFEIKEFDIKYLRDEFIEYEFISNYLPFNQINYKKFLKNEYSLEQAIANNILEFLSGIKIRLKENEKIIVNDLENIISKSIKNKNINFMGFKLKFKTNMDLPNYISLGKRKSIGFGVIKRNEANNN